MSKLYKLTKGTVSVIRKDRAGVQEAIATGYSLDGECNEAYEIVNPSPIFEDHEPAVREPSEPKRRGRPSKVESDGE